MWFPQEEGGEMMGKFKQDKGFYSFFYCIILMSVLCVCCRWDTLRQSPLEKECFLWRLYMSSQIDSSKSETKVAIFWPEFHICSWHWTVMYWTVLHILLVCLKLNVRWKMSSMWYATIPCQIRCQVDQPTQMSETRVEHCVQFNNPDLSNRSYIWEVLMMCQPNTRKTHPYFSSLCY